MNYYQLSSAVFYLTNTILMMTVFIRDHETGAEASSLPASYLDIKLDLQRDVFEEFGAGELSETETAKIKANQNLFYHPPSRPNFGLGRPQNYYGSYFQQQQQQRPLRPQLQLQNYNRPQYRPEQNEIEESDSNKIEIESNENEKETEEEKVDLIDVQFDYSDIDTIEGGISDGQDFEEIMEMVE